MTGSAHTDATPPSGGEEDVIVIRYLATLRDLTRKIEDRLPAGMFRSLVDVLEFLCDKYGEEFERRVFERKKRALRGSAVAIVNGRVVRGRDVTKLVISSGMLIVLGIFALGG